MVASVVLSNSCADSFTVTSWETAASCSVTLTVAGWLTSRSMLVRVEVPKPGAEITSVYLPGASCENWYCPLASVVFSRTAPVEVNVSRTEAPAMTAPVRSVTRPFSDVVACAMAAAPEKRRTSRESAGRIREVITAGSRKMGIHFAGAGVLVFFPGLRYGDRSGPVHCRLAPTSDWGRV